MIKAIMKNVLPSDDVSAAPTSSGTALLDRVAATAEADEGGPMPSVSHRLTKREKRMQRYGGEAGIKAFWHAKKEAKKARQREVKECKKTSVQQEWEALSEDERQRRRDAANEQHAVRRARFEAADAAAHARWADPSTPEICFDLSFEHLMNASGIGSTFGQLRFSVANIRRAEYRCRPIFLVRIGRGVASGPAPVGHVEPPPQQEATVNCLLSRLKADSLFSAAPAAPGPSHHHISESCVGAARSPVPIVVFSSWPEVAAPRTAGPWGAVPSAPRTVVYLTADSPNVLWHVRKNTTYVIGSFVDRNLHKGATMAVAVADGLLTARLPLDEGFAAAASKGGGVGNLCKVLTINHVVDCLLGYVSRAGPSATEATNDPVLWGEVFLSVLPSRRRQPGSGGSGAMPEGASALLGRKRSHERGDSDEAATDDSDEADSPSGTE